MHCRTIIEAQNMRINMSHSTSCIPTSASFPGLPTVQFLFTCSMHNWTVERPGNEAIPTCQSLHTHTPPLSAHTHLSSLHNIQDSSWPVLCHGVAMLFAMLSVSRGVSTIEPVNKVVVPILLFIIVFCFYWALFLPYSADGIIHMFSPSWSECTT